MMLYLEHNFGRGAGWIRIFSTTDSIRELDKFRCLVRAPTQALHEHNGVGDRSYLSLFGSPKDRAVLMVRAELVFPTPVERMVWEKDQPDVMKRHPTPFTGITDNDGSGTDETNRTASENNDAPGQTLEMDRTTPSTEVTGEREESSE